MSKKVLWLTQFSILLALEAIVCFTPFGSLPAIGPVVATLMYVPVIVTAILLGTKAGALMGGFAGLFSFIVWTFMPPPASAAIAFVFTPFYTIGGISGNFWSLVICFLPRIMAGTVTGLCFALFSRLLSKNKDFITYGLSGFLGSFTCTLMVVGGIALFFGEKFAEIIGAELLVIISSMILTSGIPESVLGGVLGYIICRPVKKYVLKQD